MKRPSWMWAPLLAVALVAGCAGSRQMTAQRVAIAVTDEGFVPAEVTVQKNRPVVLEVTRKTGQTFAEELELPSSGIRRDLTVGQPVEIEFTPRQTGQVEYSVGNDLYRGRIVIE